ncbi:hypothetical protein J2Z69_002183 [Paenibacillus shirakamiensis]|uniref:Flagellar hook-length control protein-like C-terminal domain-containing protein n=1 Tax=Paenibacillus shirakamiensis TaxID=1265935 RepID=A0ABS4JHE1_9BACL|nr:flagellar hook-length control protein FliK [Paenibacillus shirakamiensis]MBP2001140.1 hypothetical protein [Paenibacillus shirakamiensis]
MNIGPVVRGLMGDAKAGQPKQLDLKVGQVVRGTVMSVSDDGQEAVIQVQGVQLKATLETPLQQGQIAVLQVQPPSADGTAILKPIAEQSSTMLSDASLGETLDDIGMENTPQNREVLKIMQTQGIPLTREQTSAILKTLAAKPQNVPLQEWVQSAAIAIHRGLPVTDQSVAGLHQAVFGVSVQTVLSAFEEQIQTILSSWIFEDTEAGKEGKIPNGNKGAENVGKEAGSIHKPAGSVALGVSISSNSSNPSSPIAVETGEVDSSMGQGGELSTKDTAVKNKALISISSGHEGNYEAPEGAGKYAIPKNSIPVVTTQGLAKNNGIPVNETNQVKDDSNSHEENISSQSKTGSEINALGSSRLSTGKSAEILLRLQSLLSEIRTVAASGAAGSAAVGQGAEASDAAATTADTHAAAEPWVSRVLKLLGAEHEQQAARTVTLAEGASPAEPNAPAPRAEGAAQKAAPGAATGAVSSGVPTMAAPGEGAAPARSGAAGVLSGQPLAAGAIGSAAAEPAAERMETLKGLLLQALSSADLPAQLQDTAKQLVHQITGQQLLMNTDRMAPFAQMTLMLPFTGPDGEQTASVHIQSRRGKKGELDASNCRLWFDLDMKNLGQVVVDVQVSDKKVILNVHNEQEMIGAFIESKEEEIRAAMDSAGYRLLSLKTDLLKSTDLVSTASEQMSPYVPQAYKGVDFRI